MATVIPHIPTVDTTADLSIGTALSWVRDIRESKSSKAFITDGYSSSSPTAGYSAAVMQLTYPADRDSEVGTLNASFIYPCRYTDGSGLTTDGKIRMSFYLSAPTNFDLTAAQLRDLVLQAIADYLVGLGGALVSAKPTTSIWEALLNGSVPK